MSLSFIPTAMAATTTANPQAETFQFVFFLIVFVLFFYFILWRPQSKRAKEQKALLASLAKGDEVFTTGGILGKINKVSDDFVILSIAEGMDVVIQKSSIAGLVPKGTMKSV